MKLLIFLKANKNLQGKYLFVVFALRTGHICLVLLSMMSQVPHFGMSLSVASVYSARDESCPGMRAGLSQSVLHMMGANENEGPASFGGPQMTFCPVAGVFPILAFSQASPTHSRGGLVRFHLTYLPDLKKNLQNACPRLICPVHL